MLLLHICKIYLSGLGQLSHSSYILKRCVRVSETL